MTLCIVKFLHLTLSTHFFPEEKTFRIDFYVLGNR